MNLLAVFEKPDGCKSGLIAAILSERTMADHTHHPPAAIELVTPPLEDMILPGVTRDSILALARGHADGSHKLAGLPANFSVVERNMTMPEIVQASEDGSLKEIFGSGTAAIISTVNAIGYEGRDVPVPVGEDGLGDVARVMLREIQGIQTGAIERGNWSVKV